MIERSMKKVEEEEEGAKMLLKVLNKKVRQLALSLGVEVMKYEAALLMG